jgi:hypothetical protein
MKNIDSMDIGPTDFSTYAALPGGKSLKPPYMGVENKITPLLYNQYEIWGILCSYQQTAREEWTKSHDIDRNGNSRVPGGLS